MRRGRVKRCNLKGASKNKRASEVKRGGARWTYDISLPPPSLYECRELSEYRYESGKHGE